MKILISDDQLTRYQRLIERFEEMGVRRDDIDLVPSANDARRLLASRTYDLLILDILLPLRAEESDCLSTNSVDLLLELSEGDSLIRPMHIVGITGDKSIVADAESSFTDSTWIVIEYSAISDEWMQNIENCVTYIQAKKRATNQAAPDFGVDLAVICALESPELEELLKLDWNWSTSEPIDDMTFVYRGWLFCGDCKINVVAACAERMGMVSSALLSAKIISILRPKLLAMCGICAGVEGKVKQGEVLFADPAWDFQAGKQVLENGVAEFSMAPHQIAADPIVRSHTQQIATETDDLASIFTEFGGDAVAVPRIHIGPVATGSAVLADGEIVRRIE
ncbi:MAG: hypothetical protein DRR42_21405, partial [Gammaproteobacteria bacterium]